VWNIWKRYSRNGVLSVKVGTSFEWVGPEAVYVLDKHVVGSNVNWIIESPYPGLSADRVDICVDETCYAVELYKKTSIDLTLKSSNRFSVIRLKSNKSFVPAIENWGPAYFSLSLISKPLPMGKGIISVQSIPCFPTWDYLTRQESERNDPRRAISDPEPVQILSNSGYLHMTKRRFLKVAFFTAYPANVGSGCERLIYNTARALIEQGHDVRVYVMNLHWDKDPPFFVHKLPTLPLEKLFERVHSKLTGLNDFLFPSTALLRLRQWLISADIWHFHNLHAHYLSIPLLGLLSRTKHLVISPVDQYLSTGHCPYPMDCERYLIGCGSCPRLNETYPGITRDVTHTLWNIKYLFFRFSRLNMLFHTRALTDHYSGTFAKYQPSRTIHYGVDLCTYRKLQRKSSAIRLGVEASSRFVVGLFHSYLLDPRKGILPIIKRLGELSKQFPGEIELLIVGNQGHSVKETVPPELSVTVLPYLKHAHELANALNLCDVLLYPTQAENLSLTCLNALACGVPVISYDAGGQKEAIKNGYNGFIVDINDEDGMISHLEEMMKNPDLCRQLSEGARASAEKDFDFDRYIDDLIEYYEGIVRFSPNSQAVQGYRNE
jgi:glycosyltransferase involved in cell wall biosynthesis